MKNILKLLVLCLAFTSCDETKKVINTASQVELSGSYTVTNLEGKDITENAPDLNFSVLEKRVSGSTGCNRYFASYAIDLYALSFSEMASTEMACPDPQMNTEFVFTSALRNVGSYSLEKGTLVLYSKNDRSVLMTAQKNNPEEN